MNFIKTEIEGVYIIEPKVFGDNRGYFFESYNEKEFKKNGLDYTFVQDNESKSKKGVLRGLHFQKTYPQAKLVRVLEGEVFDVAVDLRRDSKTFGKWVGYELTEENKKMLYIPPYFAHGFLVLSEEAEFAYKCDDVYNHAGEGGLKWNDPEVGIVWPEVPGMSKEDYLTSEKDGKWPTLSELRNTDLFQNLK